MTEGIKCRTVLWYLTFVGFAVNYMLRININITIVDMIKPRLPPAKTSLSDTQCFVPESLANTSSSSSSDDFLNITVSRSRPISPFFTLERSAMDRFGMAYESEGFDWNEYESGLVLGSFYWLHWVTQIPGGILAQRYGPKLVFGLSNFIGCLMCAVIPLLSYYSLKVLIWFRVLQGLIVGLAWPAMHTMTGRWIPPNERSKFVTAYMGSSIGVAALYPLFGYVIAWSSWEWVYHLCVVIGIAWYLGWHFLVFDSPADHPRITADERDYIEKSLGSSIRREAGVIPWRAILTSKPVWITVISQWGGIWGLFTMMTQAPTYFKLIHGWSISMTGILSGVPHLMRTCFAYAFSLLGDRLLEKGTMTRTNVRKLAGFVCTIINGGFIVALAFTGCNSTAAVTFLTLSLMVHGAVSTGPLANVVDISPNHAGIVLGLSGMIGVLPGFISPVIVGVLTLGNQTAHQWKLVFLITAANLIVCGLLYVLFTDANVQPWNSLTKIRPGGEDPAKHIPLLLDAKEKDAEEHRVVPSIKIENVEISKSS